LGAKDTLARGSGPRRDIVSPEASDAAENTWFALWYRGCFKKGMTSEKKSFLLGQLQRAIDEAVSESGRVCEIVEEMRRGGFELYLMLESTVTISPVESGSADRAEESADADVELTAEDLAFLQELNIGV